MADIEIRYHTQEVPDNSFRDMPGKVGQVRVLGQTVGFDGNDFLKPARPEAVVAEADLGGAFFALEPDLQRLNEANQQGAVEKTQVAQYPVPADVARKSILNLGHENALPRRLSSITAGKAEHFLQQFLVSFLTAPCPNANRA